MDRPAAAVARGPDFARVLKDWRARRRLTQLALSLAAGVSARHLSWLEGGKAEPSRAMVLRLAEALDVPLRERNALLRAAGFAPLYRERTLDDEALAPARAAVQRVLDAHEPYPALAVDRHWTLVAHNRMVPPLMAAAAPALREPPVNVLRLVLHPQGLAPCIVDLPAWRSHVLRRLARQAAVAGDPALQRLHDELAGYDTGVPTAATPPAADTADDPDATPVALPLTLESPIGRLSLIGMVAVFGAPHDIAVSELAIESFFPADPVTAERLRAAHAALG